MSDDIVTRLRDNCACSIAEEFGFVCAFCTAVDEIERLRKELTLALGRTCRCVNTEARDES